MTYAYVVIINGTISARVLRQITTISPKLRGQIKESTVLFDNTLLVATELTATDLAKTLRALLKSSIKNILVLDAATDRNGWLPKSAWEFLRKYDGPSPIEVDDSVADEDTYYVEDEDED